MNLKNFLKDRISLMVFYALLLVFVSLVIFLDNFKNKIIYINAVGISLLIFYLAYSYYKSKYYYQGLKEIIENKNADAVVSLPKAPSNEKKVYEKLILKLYEDQNIKLNELHQKEADTVDFINYIVHEIKTPISASKLILENSDLKSKDELIDIMEDEINKIHNYVEQALYYSRADSFSKDYMLNDIFLKDFLSAIIKKQAKIFISKKIKLQLDCLDFWVTSDSKWLFFIIDQILLNGLKYTSSYGTIKIYGTAEKNEKLLVIEDNGMGIKAEDLGRVFDKGFTGSNGRENMSATGIGLYLSRKLALRLGHDISIESTYHEYTKVTIHFPKLSEYYKL